MRYCLSSRRARHNTTLDMETGPMDSEPQVTSCILELQKKIREDITVTEKDPTGNLLVESTY